MTTATPSPVAVTKDSPNIRSSKLSLSKVDSGDFSVSI